MNIKNIKPNTKLILIILMVVFMYLLFATYIFQVWNSENDRTIGILGDSFGILNTLFSGLAFAVILYTIFLQQEELKETRQVFLQQRFDDKFFKLLELNRNARNQLVTTNVSSGDRLADALKGDFFKEFAEAILDNKISSKEELNILYLDKLSAINRFDVQDSYQIYASLLTSLVNHVINNNKLLQFDVEEYTNIIISQMGVMEVRLFTIQLIIFYDASIISSLKFRKFISDPMLLKLI